jgi:hypothetical protein
LTRRTPSSVCKPLVICSNQIAGISLSEGAMRRFLAQTCHRSSGRNTVGLLSETSVPFNLPANRHTPRAAFQISGLDNPVSCRMARWLLYAICV